jgi:hypothetical protein
MCCTSGTRGRGCILKNQLFTEVILLSTHAGHNNRRAKRIVVLLGFWTSVCTLVIGLVLAGWWAYDVGQDRKHSVIVESQTQVFTGSANGLCGGQRLTTLQAGNILPVRRIRYWKNCATIDVGLPDGRRGYLVLGEGDTKVSPPLTGM